MNKEFVSYEMALELKHLGFYEPCFGEWQNLKRGKNLVVDEEDRIYDICVLGADIKAPLYQQAFSWLREKHNIQCHIQYHKSDHIWYSFHITFEVLATGENPPVYVKHYTDSWLGLNIEYKTYEEAEIACLHRCISILKNK
jgi:hypothetical protein